MKILKLLLSSLFFMGMCAVSAKANPPCLTNVTIRTSILNTIAVSGTTNYQRVTFGITGMALLADDCTNGPTLTIFASSCGSGGAEVTWACTPSCGPGGTLNIAMPSGCKTIVIRLFISGTCQLSYCTLACEPCSNEQ